MSDKSGYSAIVQSKPLIRVELTLIHYELRESCIDESTNMQNSSNEESWISGLFGRESEGFRIYGNSSGGSISTRDDGYSSGS